MSLRFTILGCGSSGGVPRAGQGWGACDPAEPRNRRLRCSLLVQREGPHGVTNVLVDTGPDLRQQLLNCGVTRLDAILLTHAHADHIHGIDDVRPLVINARQRIDVYMDNPTAALVRARFGYIFETPPGSQYPALLNPHELNHGVEVRIEGPGGAIAATGFELDHGDMQALGFRFSAGMDVPVSPGANRAAGVTGHSAVRSLAYSPDVVDVPAKSLGWLEGLDVWVVDALRYMPHPSHFHLSQTLEWIARMKPGRAILTNLHTDMDYATLAGELPEGVEPAHDGLVVCV